MAQYIPHQKFSPLRWMICGALIGAGAILPGVSGGVMAVIFDIYRPFMEILTAPRRGLAKYRQGLIPLVLGWCAGFLGFSKGIAAAMSVSAPAVTWLFIGLIAGTLPSLFRQAGKEGRSRAGWLSFFLCAAAMYALLFSAKHVSQITVSPNLWWYNFCGVLWGIGIIVPGMTTSSILMALGLYRPLLDALGRLDLPVLSACLPGMLITMALLSRGVDRLFRRHYTVTFHGIAGIVIASTAAIIPTLYSGMGEILLCALLCILGAASTSMLERADRRKG